MKNKRLEINITDDEETVKTTLAGWKNETIRNAKVMVVGAGALGNEVLKNLALVGVNQLVIVDFDVIEKSNLAKSVLYRERDCSGEKRKVEIATERLKDINPDLKIMAINGDATLDVGLGVFREMDVVISCLDNRLTRVWISRFCSAVNKAWIDGGILQMEGQVDVYMPKVNCYECGLGPKAWKNIEYRNGCINRMKRYASAGLANTNSIVASIVGAIQVQEALKVIAEPNRSLAGFQFSFNGYTNYYDKLGKISPVKNSCRSHELYEQVITASVLSADTTIADSLKWLKDYFDNENIVIALHYILILTAATGTSGKIKPLIKPRQQITEKDLDSIREIEDEEVRFREWTDQIDGSFPISTSGLRISGFLIIIF